MRDLHNHIAPKKVLSPQYSAGDSALVGDIIDRQGFNSLEYVIQAGSIPDANVTFAVLLEESDDSGMSGATAVADADLLGTEALATPLFSSDNKVFKLGYVGNKRYTRLTVTPSGNSSPGCYLSAVALLGHPAIGPTVNPPA